MALYTVELPISKAPIERSAGLFLGVLAFPAHQKMAEEFGWAYWREALRLSAIESEDFALEPYFLPPKLFVMRDFNSDKLLKDAEKNIFLRKQAWHATQVLFEGALRGSPFLDFHDASGRWQTSAENRYLATLRWTGRAEGDNPSTKPFTRDVISPAKPVLHLAFAFWKLISSLTTRDEHSINEDDASHILLGNAEAFARLIGLASECRAAAMTIPQFKVCDTDLVDMILT